MPDMTLSNKIKVGQPAPEVLLSDINNRSQQLSTCWANGRHTLLIFLRHLA